MVDILFLFGNTLKLSFLLQTFSTNLVMFSQVYTEVHDAKGTVPTLLPIKLPLYYVHDRVLVRTIMKNRKKYIYTAVKKRFRSMVYLKFDGFNKNR